MTTSKPLMSCNCAPDGKRWTPTSEGSEEGSYSTPCCTVHGSTTPADPQPDLTKRKATCDYCGSVQPSSTDLAFFRYLNKKPADDYYCGCRGWD